VEESGLVVKLIKITGHAGIPGNEYVNCKAKKLAKNRPISILVERSILPV